MITHDGICEDLSTGAAGTSRKEPSQLSERPVLIRQQLLYTEWRRVWAKVIPIIQSTRENT